MSHTRCTQQTATNIISYLTEEHRSKGLSGPSHSIAWAPHAHQVIHFNPPKSTPPTLLTRMRVSDSSTSLRQPQESMRTLLRSCAVPHQ